MRMMLWNFYWIEGRDKWEDRHGRNCWKPSCLPCSWKTRTRHSVDAWWQCASHWIMPKMIWKWHSCMWLQVRLLLQRRWPNLSDFFSGIFTESMFPQQNTIYKWRRSRFPNVKQSTFCISRRRFHLNCGPMKMKLERFFSALCSRSWNAMKIFGENFDDHPIDEADATKPMYRQLPSQNFSTYFRVYICVRTVGEPLTEINL